MIVCLIVFSKYHTLCTHLRCRNSPWPMKTMKMQIKQKRNKKVLESKSAKVAFRKISIEKSKKKTTDLQTKLDNLKSKASSNEKAVEIREKYLERLDEMICDKKKEIETERRVLSEQQAGMKANSVIDSSTNSKAEAKELGPNVMEYILQKAEMYELREGIRTLERKIDIAEGRERLHVR